MGISSKLLARRLAFQPQLRLACKCNLAIPTPPPLQSMDVVPPTCDRSSRLYKYRAQRSRLGPCTTTDARTREHQMEKVPHTPIPHQSRLSGMEHRGRSRAKLSQRYKG
mmetsp:Transcript_4824/g.5583  ORF Transcript_4824/g.5583 Transcript_4824/m.5583 type:complete len:109 (+) Transcript_4824:590-916(+)